MTTEFDRGPWRTVEEKPEEWVTRYDGVKVSKGETAKEAKQAAMRWWNGNGTTPNHERCTVCGPEWDPHFTHIKGDPNKNG